MYLVTIKKHSIILNLTKNYWSSGRDSSFCSASEAVGGGGESTVPSSWSKPSYTTWISGSMANDPIGFPRASNSKTGSAVASAKFVTDLDFKH